eukprot:CAMPEP_0174754736 /NCGR_PEP_ID=MMETSP1094-20130205/105890_1 /TAXON_ID=156173 /ORGANISM="Chrysochromulina brevifilum, Strain UTEX LB 985" /LENGTH=137 /DNA_ID=CAMNT_0015960615 /DNA_START=680 /DNA_END=1093 /DNA_ORIENTATION=-
MKLQPVASRRVASHRSQMRRSSTSATCGTDAGQSARERSDLAEDPLGACWLPSEPSWSGWQRLAGTLSWAGRLTRGGGDKGVCMAPRHPNWECTTPSVPPEGGRSEEHFVRVPLTGKNMWANAGVELEVEPAPMREE